MKKLRQAQWLGYPTKRVIPFGEVTVAAADISTSTDATTATTFTFPSPVFLQGGEEYCFVALTNIDEYTIYTSTVGEKTLDGSRLISKQPILGSMFASQNNSTWDAVQGEDVKFNLRDLLNDVKYIPSHLLENSEGKSNELIDVKRIKLID